MYRQLLSQAVSAQRKGSALLGGCCGNEGSALLGGGYYVKGLTKDEYKVPAKATVTVDPVTGQKIKIYHGAIIEKDKNGKPRHYVLISKDEKQAQVNRAVMSRRETNAVNKQAIARAEQMRLAEINRTRPAGKKPLTRLSREEKCMIACHQKMITRRVKGEAKRELTSLGEFVSPQILNGLAADAAARQRAEVYVREGKKGPRGPSGPRSAASIQKQIATLQRTLASRLGEEKKT